MHNFKGQMKKATRFSLDNCNFWIIQRGKVKKKTIFKGKKLFRRKVYVISESGGGERKLKCIGDRMGNEKTCPEFFRSILVLLTTTMLTTQK